MMTASVENAIVIAEGGERLPQRENRIETTMRRTDTVQAEWAFLTENEQIDEGGYSGCRRSHPRRE